MPRGFHLSALDVVLVLALASLIPERAFAWGPAAHIDFATEALRYLALAAPVMRRLLLGHPDPFLYGNFAADVVVGKNRAPERLHCHGWHVGMRLLKAASDPVERSFAAGYVAHLAADSVAHMEYVPAKLVESFDGTALRHVYWELRFDSRVLQRRPDVAETWRRVVKDKAGRLDRFLAGNLHAALLSHRTSRGIFAGTMLLQRRLTWIRMAERIDQRSPFPLAGDEFEWYRDRAIEAVLRFLSDPEGRLDAPPDPVGAGPIAEALALRKDLRRARRRRALPERAWMTLGPALRDAIARARPLGEVVDEVVWRGSPGTSSGGWRCGVRVPRRRSWSPCFAGCRRPAGLEAGPRNPRPAGPRSKRRWARWRRTAPGGSTPIDGAGRSRRSRRPRGTSPAGRIWPRTGPSCRG